MLRIGAQPRIIATTLAVCGWIGLLGGARLAQAQTYAQSATTYNFIATAGHTAIATWPGGLGCPTANGDDNLSALLNIGFTFTFGVTNYTQLRVFTNGRLQFANNFCNSGTQTVGPPRTYPNPMPDPNTNSTIRIYGADLDLSVGGTLTYATVGVTPNRSFVVTWANVPQWNAVGTSYNLQIQLRENGDFLLMYGSAVNVSTAGETLGPAQLGWQLSTADFFAQSGLPGVGTAYLFAKPRAAPLVQKTSTVLSDPINGAANPKRIPGSVVRYAVQVTNTGGGPVDANTVAITDPVPPNTDLYVSTASGNPVEFIDGIVTSGLTFNYAANVSFSNQPGGGAPYTYLPVPDANGFDPAVTGLRVAPGGAMSPAAAGSQPSFSVRFRVRLR